jgi:dihydrofolate reductase
MGRIVISENVTLDGVVQDPTGEDGFDRGGWWGQIEDDDNRAWAEVTARGAMEAAALLLGRRTYAWLAARFPARTGAWADRLNTMPKYVVSSTLTDPEWPNSTVLNGDAVEEVTKLKDRVDGDIVVNASAQLVATLVEHDLADELRLFVFPFVLGDGERLFAKTSEAKRMRLVATTAVGRELVLLTYERGHDA